MSSVNLNNCTKQMWCVSLLCRLMNIWIYLHKACTKLLQLTVIGWTITLLSKMAGEVCFCFFEAIFHCVYFISKFFLWLAYVLCWHANCKLGLAVFTLFFFFSSLCVEVTGCLKMCRPTSQLVCRVRVQSVPLWARPWPWSWKTLWSSGWLLTTERGSQCGWGL